MSTENFKTDLENWKAQSDEGIKQVLVMLERNDDGSYKPAGGASFSDDLRKLWTIGLRDSARAMSLAAQFGAILQTRIENE